jgi:hypothetical protein
MSAFPHPLFWALSDQHQALSPAHAFQTGAVQAIVCQRILVHVGAMVRASAEDMLFAAMWIGCDAGKVSGKV